MIILLSTGFTLLLILHVIQRLKLRRLIKALADTNKAQNETREAVSNQNKEITKIISILNRIR